mmetsp:Transcript_86389/g.272611  ORF Transcript_86389/g.272611 Transcript_86389/m.272611 type:complete len:253 (+) Transcript_86389:1097-1855(+)
MGRNAALLRTPTARQQVVPDVVLPSDEQPRAAAGNSAHDPQVQGNVVLLLVRTVIGRRRCSRRSRRWDRAAAARALRREAENGSCPSITAGVGDRGVADPQLVPRLRLQGSHDLDLDHAWETAVAARREPHLGHVLYRDGQSRRRGGAFRHELQIRGIQVRPDLLVELQEDPRQEFQVHGVVQRVCPHEGGRNRVRDADRVRSALDEVLAVGVLDGLRPEGQRATPGGGAEGHLRGGRNLEAAAFDLEPASV